MFKKTKADCLFEIGNTLGAEFIKRADGVSASQGISELYSKELLFFFAKAYKSYKAIELLWKKGYWQDALVILRTVFELDAQARYLSADPKHRAQLFADYELIAKCRALRNVKAVSPKLFDDDAEQRLALLEERCGPLWKKYPKYKGWYGMSIRDLASAVAGDFPSRYGTAYAYTSKFVHSDLASSPAYLEQGDGEYILKCGPEPCDDLACPTDATFHLGNIVELCAKALGLNMEAAAVEARSAYDKACNDIQANPEE